MVATYNFGSVYIKEKCDSLETVICVKFTFRYMCYYFFYCVSCEYIAYVLYIFCFHIEH